jgi:predicted O-linked N-acetylglucosamine transferase (SPINDLY family)
MEPNQPSESVTTDEPLTRLQATEQAFALAVQGALSVIELFNATRRLTEAKQTDIAIQLYQLWINNTQSPIAYAAHFNLGVLLSNNNDQAGAERAYRSAITLKSDFVEGHLNLGTLLEAKGQPELALETWRKVLGIINLDVENDRPFYTQALNNLGRLLEIRKQNAQAQEMLHRSLLINPKQPNVITHWVHLRQKQCEWPIYSPIDGISMVEMVSATSALAMLSASDDPAEQLAASRRYVEKNILKNVQSMSNKRGYGHQRLRIGYLSSDFGSHAVSILIAELLELHDREKVEVYGFCWTKEDGTPLRARMIAAMDHHIRIGALNDQQAAKCIRDYEIDILIDLHGLTSGMRANILSYRPAPLQMTYLGFPGSTALPEIDYVLSDKFVLPPELTPFFTEKPLYLPNTFQINDRKRVIGPRPSRASCGLPEDAFVFCSFNNNHKFTPEVFGCWMRILLRASNSVLWLIADSEQVQDNLLLEAERLGVSRSRLFFADRVGPDAYLARYQVADLFLDTLPFNAGTTASDALWAGLPLLTCVGHTFAARMAGSLLLAAELPELITYNFQDYEDKAAELAEQPTRVTAIKQHLAQTRLSCALFDSPRFVRDFEQVLQQVLTQNLPAETDLMVASTPDTTRSVNIQEPKEIKKMTKSLDIGCGHKPRNFFNADEVFGVDVRDDVDAGIYRADLVIEPIPFPDETFEFVTAHDFLEHIPRVLYVPQRRNAFVEVMNEIWRVLKPGGQFLSFTPAFPYAPAFRDPTHVNIITDETFPIYFDNKIRAASMYGFYGAFEVVSQEWLVPHLVSILRKVNMPA